MKKKYSLVSLSTALAVGIVSLIRLNCMLIQIYRIVLIKLLFVTFIIFCYSNSNTIVAQERDRFFVSIYPRQIFLGEVKLKQNEICLAELDQNINSGLAYRVGYFTPKSYLRTSYTSHFLPLKEGGRITSDLLFIDWAYKGFFVGLGSGRGKVRQCFNTETNFSSGATAFNLGYNYDITKFIQIGSGYLQVSFDYNSTLVIRTFFLEISYLF